MKFLRNNLASSRRAVCRIIVTLILLTAANGLPAQLIRWTEFEALPDSMRRQARPVLIFIHTSWCRYCALQDHNTFNDEQTAELINKKFYALRLDAESAEDIYFLNRIYRSRQHGYHELAEFLSRSGGQLIFPTTILLDESFRLSSRLTGFQTPEELRRKLPD